jgi:ParB family chromosome partitioning protein
MKMNNAVEKEEIKKEVVQIPTEAIMPNRSQPRTTFEQESLKRLSESIAKYGILQPLTVRKIPEKSKFSIFQYELIAGERRLRASKLIGLPTVPCIIVEIDTKTSAALAIIENLHRDDLNMFEEASAIASLIELHSLTQEQIAEQLSLTQSAIANKLRILKLTDAEKNVILSYNLTERHARALLKIKNIPARMEALSHITKFALNVKQTEEYIEKILFSAEKESKKGYFDYKCLLASIKKAIENTRENGVYVKTAHTESDSEIIYTISITKPTV